MTAPSQTPEAAGLEVVAWRSSWTGLTGRVVHALHEKKAEAILNAKWMQNAAFEPLVTAASAQARIAELEEAGRLLAAKAEHAINEGFQHITRATAAEARADRLAKALVMLGGEKPEQKRSYTNSYRGGFDAATDLAASIARAALQQEPQK